MAPVARQPISPEAQRALTLLGDHWREFSDLRTLADISVQRGPERQQLRGVLLAKAPASVRFEALSPLGQPLLLATIHEGQLTAYDATTNEAYVGPATAEATGRLLSLPFEPDDLVAILGGHAIPPKDVRAAELLTPDALGPSLGLTGKANRQRIWMDLGTGMVRQVELSGGPGASRITFARDGEGRMLGFDLSGMLSILRATVRYRNPDFNADVPVELFTFVIPKGAKIQRIR